MVKHGFKKIFSPICPHLFSCQNIPAKMTAVNKTASLSAFFFKAKRQVIDRFIFQKAAFDMSQKCFRTAEPLHFHLHPSPFLNFIKKAARGGLKLSGNGGLLFNDSLFPSLFSSVYLSFNTGSVPSFIQQIKR